MMEYEIKTEVVAEVHAEVAIVQEVEIQAALIGTVNVQLEYRTPEEPEAAE